MSILSCNDCDTDIDTDLHPDWFRIANIPFCRLCAPNCENCKHWAETNGSKHWRVTTQRSVGYGYCDHIRDELVVEIIGAELTDDDGNFVVKFETPSNWGCSEYERK